MNASSLTLDQVQTALDAAPFHRWLGLNAVSLDTGTIMLETVSYTHLTLPTTPYV